MCDGCEKRVCKSCNWFNVLPDTENPTTGWCLRFPPVYVGRPFHDDSTYEDVMSPLCWANPRVGIMATCGEWTRRKR